MPRSCGSHRYDRDCAGCRRADADRCREYYLRTRKPPAPKTAITCIDCGKTEARGPHADRLRCQPCRNRFNRKRYLYALTCEGCGDEFTSKRPGIRVCSLRCRDWINPRVAKSVAVPVTHPAHPDYVPPAVPVSLRHPDRADWVPVVWDDCAWCSGPVTVKPSCRYWMGSLYCSRKCQRKRNKVSRRAREVGASGSYTWGELMRLHVAAGRMCSYCDVVIEGQPDPDHVVPLSRGGSNSISNIVPACRECNCDKSDMLLEEWRLKDSTRVTFRHRRYELTGPRFFHLAVTRELVAA